MSREAPTPRPLPVTILALACAAIVTALDPAAARGNGRAEGGDALREWIDGPVRYIAVAEERKQFRALDTDVERSVFIERFWARRDPRPETLVNEYRTLFWERVQEANRTLVDSPRPGWMTDRGKIYILYGPPTEIEDRPMLDTGSGPIASRGLIRWIYEKPGGREDVDPVVVVPFVRDVTGEYRLSSDPRLASVFLEFDSLKHEQVRAHEELMAAMGAIPRRSELSVMLDLGRLQEVPPAERVLLERVETVETYGADPLDVEIGTFRHPGRDGAIVSLTVRVPDLSADSPPALLARVRPAGPGDERVLGEGSFKFRSAASGGVVAQARIVLDPGTYGVLVAAARPYSARTALWTGTVVARARSSALRLGEVVLAERIEPVEVAALRSWDEPFYLGPFRYLPRAPGPHRRGDAVELLYEIDGGMPPYTVTYRLEGREDDGRWTSLGRPASRTDAETVQAWQLPTGPHWPPGAYRIAVEVADALGETATAAVPFSLDGDPAGAEATGSRAP